MATTKKASAAKKRTTRKPKTTPMPEPVMESTPVMVSQPQNQTNKFLIVLVVALVLFCGYLFKEINALKTNPQANTAGTQQAPPSTVEDKVVQSFLTDDHVVLGDKNAKNIILEISDSSCPFCHVAAGHNPELATQMGAQFQSVADGGSYTPPGPEIEKLVESGEAVYVNMFGSGHGNGFLAAEALYCADAQDAFWPVHNKIMTNDAYTLLNDEVKNDREKSDQLAQFLSAEIDPSYMTECLTSKKYEKLVSRDVQKNAELYFSGTPHYVVNGKIFAGAVDFKSMESALK